MQVFKNTAFFWITCIAAGILYAVTPGYFNYVVVALLAATLVVLCEMLIWMRSLADTLGCVPARKRRIDALIKKLEKSTYAETDKKITEKENEELGELAPDEWMQEPAKTAQLVRIIELLNRTTEFQRPETKQLERIAELLTEIRNTSTEPPKFHGAPSTGVR